MPERLSGLPPGGPIPEEELATMLEAILAAPMLALAELLELRDSELLLVLLW